MNSMGEWVRGEWLCDVVSQRGLHGWWPVHVCEPGKRENMLVVWELVLGLSRFVPDMICPFNFLNLNISKPKHPKA